MAHAEGAQSGAVYFLDPNGIRLKPLRPAAHARQWPRAGVNVRMPLAHLTYTLTLAHRMILARRIFESGIMLVRRTIEVAPSEITPPDEYFRRRRFLGAAGAGAIALQLPFASRAASDALFKNPLKSAFSTTEAVTAFAEATAKTRFRELEEDIIKNAEQFNPRPWKVAVEGECLKPGVFDVDDLLTLAPLEERIYRMRCTDQRSMGFFRSLNKKAEIGSILMLGNSVKLPGLAQYLSKNLAMDVQVLEGFEQLTGDEVITAPAFKEHLPAFGPVYGLCLQMLSKGPAQTNLVPTEIFERAVDSLEEAMGGGSRSSANARLCRQFATSQQSLEKCPSGQVEASHVGCGEHEENQRHQNHRGQGSSQSNRIAYQDRQRSQRKC